jgi:hypothetical protein
MILYNDIEALLAYWKCIYGQFKDKLFRLSTAMIV